MLREWILEEIEFSHANAGDVLRAVLIQGFFTRPGPLATFRITSRRSKSVRYSITSSAIASIVENKANTGSALLPMD